MDICNDLIDCVLNVRDGRVYESSAYSWLFFAFLVIGPPAALVAFTRMVMQNPVLIALLVVGYEVLLIRDAVAAINPRVSPIPYCLLPGEAFHS